MTRTDRGPLKGRTSGLGVCAFIACLFEANELIPPAKKLTDKQLAQKITREFPTRKPLLVNQYRSYYNRGRLTKGTLPSKLSFRYNHQGFRVEPKYGRRILSGLEIECYNLKHRKLLAEYGR